jgi:heme exporter protein CcmD
MGIELWMRENPMTYIWLGSYAVAMLVCVIEIVMVINRRKITLNQIRLMRNSGENE